MQHDLVASLAGRAPLKLQVAGGFRDAAAVAAALAAGASRVVIGSLAVRDPAAVRAVLAAHGADRIALALDVNVVDGAPLVATAGWAPEPEPGSGASPRFPRSARKLATPAR